MHTPHPWPLHPISSPMFSGEISDQTYQRNAGSAVHAPVYSFRGHVEAKTETVLRLLGQACDCPGKTLQARGSSGPAPSQRNLALTLSMCQWTPPCG